MDIADVAIKKYKEMFNVAYILVEQKDISGTKRLSTYRANLPGNCGTQRSGAVSISQMHGIHLFDQFNGD
ncbi:TPA: hypothetical protein QB352_001667 [Pasteurella multocida]|nr:hypothetical protein [Pasteurella multocida]